MVPDAPAAETVAPSPVAPPAPQPIPTVRRRWFATAGGSAAPVGAAVELKVEEKRTECVRDSEVSKESEIVNMVVETNVESGEAWGKMDSTEAVVDLS